MAAELGNLFQAFAPRRRLKLVIFFVTSICNARCRTCFYWEELNQRGDLTWDEIQKLSRSMPRFTDLWLSGGEPMLRKELPEILRLFYTNNGIRWTNLPTNGLLPERTAEWTARICAENPELQLDLNVALDGLGEMQDSIRAVPGNFEKTFQTLELLRPCRTKFSNLRVNVNTVVCAENFDGITEIGDYVWKNCAVDGHYFNIIRGNAKDPALKQIPSSRLPGLFREVQQVYSRYAARAVRRKGLSRKLAEAYYAGTLAFHNQVQLENIESPHPWPMPCTASETSIVIDYNGDVRACELRSKLGNLREVGCDFARFWDTLERREESSRITNDQCWCTHVCFIHDSLRHSPKVLAFDIPLAYLRSKFQTSSSSAALQPSKSAPKPAQET
ncbi:MAG: radical SAM/SPASM domain-containing protein [Deltaproteobacteria bacterium]